jgi:hypothetical protein
VSGSVFAYGRTWPSAAAVVEAENRVRENRCVTCGQDMTGRLCVQLSAALTECALLRTELHLLRSGEAR